MTTRRLILSSLIALAAIGVAAYFFSRPGPAGELGDDLAEAIGCQGDTEITEKSKDDPDAPRVFGITCSTGEINPYVTLYRFDDRQSLRQFLVVKRFKWLACVANLDVFDDGIGGIHRFGQFCADHGGVVRRPLCAPGVAARPGLKCQPRQSS
jgi:hypothetical protein